VRAFDSFWESRPGPGGVGLQDRFAAAWRHLARRFRDEPAVIGYDLLNEPYPSPAIQAAILSYANAAAKLTTAETKLKFLAAFARPDAAKHYAELAAPFQDPQTALRLVDEGGLPIARFERERLLPLYERVIAAIREVDPHHLCFIEPTAVGGAVRTGLARPTDPSGKPFAHIVFAPHYYEVATEFRLPYERNRARMHALVGRICQTARELDMPVWFGEWGNVPAGLDGGRECIRDALDALNANLAGRCYWEYGRHFAKLPHLDLLTRPYPQAIAGVPGRLKVDDHELVLEVEDIIPRVPTVLWLPPGTHATLTVREPGEAAARATVRHSGNEARVTCPGGVPSYTLTLRRRARDL
jgi:endoglycosylceramidase